MTHETGAAASVNHSPVTWPRRTLLGFFVLAFLLATFGLVARWDSLMLRLSEPPVSTPAPEAMR